MGNGYPPVLICDILYCGSMLFSVDRAGHTDLPDRYPPVLICDILWQYAQCGQGWTPRYFHDVYPWCGIRFTFLDRRLRSDHLKKR